MSGMTKWKSVMALSSDERHALRDKNLAKKKRRRKLAKKSKKAGRK